jgi:hypothetical protein
VPAPHRPGQIPLSSPPGSEPLSPLQGASDALSFEIQILRFAKDTVLELTVVSHVCGRGSTLDTRKIAEVLTWR